MGQRPLAAKHHQDRAIRDWVSVLTQYAMLQNLPVPISEAAVQVRTKAYKHVMDSAALCQIYDSIFRESFSMVPICVRS